MAKLTDSNTYGLEWLPTSYLMHIHLAMKEYIANHPEKGREDEQPDGFMSATMLQLIQIRDEALAILKTRPDA